MSDIISHSDEFFETKNALLYETLAELYDQDRPADIVQIKQKLDDKGVLARVGGVQYLSEVMESVPSAASAPHYAKIVHDKAILRKLLSISSEIIEDVYVSPDEPKEQLERAESKVFAVAELGDTSQNASHIGELARETKRRMDESDGRVVTGLSTGFYDLDEITSGLQKGEMIIMAARPSMGKTALAMNIVENAAGSGVGVGVFSLEMARSQLAERMVSSMANVEIRKIRRNMVNAEERSQVEHSVGMLGDMPIYVDDTANLSVMALRAKARRMFRQHSLDLIVIDYMQLMSGKGTDRQSEVSSISRGIKAMAREMHIPVICLSQLNRNAEAREGNRPKLGDLRESGSIEQDADVVMMIHRDDYYKKDNPDYQPDNKAEVIIAKQRNGPVGKIDLQFRGGCTKFTNRSRPQDGILKEISYDNRRDGFD